MRKGIPKWTEVHFVGRFHLPFGFLGLVLPPPIDVVVSGDGEPRAGKFIHDGFVFLHLRHPNLFVAVAVDEVTDSHDEVGFKEIGVAHGVGKDGDAIVRSSGAVTVDNETKGVFLVGKGKFHVALARGVESFRGGFDGLMFFTVAVMMMIVTDVWIDRRRIGEGGRKTETEDGNP